MRTLTPTLEAAQRSASAVPYVRVRLRDFDLGVPRLRWTRWYEGSEAPGPCVAAVPADGSLLRARIDVATSTLYHSRVATPSASSTYSGWTSLGTVATAPRLALAAAGTRALLVTVRTGSLIIEVRESTDSGATFAASSVLTTAGATVTAVACTLQSDGTAAVFYAVGGVVHAIKRTGTGSWSSPSSWSLTLATVTGLAATFDLDYQLLVSGTTSASVPGVWSTTYGAGGATPSNTWLPLVEVTAASPSIGMSYLATSVAVAGAPRATLVETYTGFASTSNRAHLVTALASTTFADQQWRDPTPLDVADAHGVGLASAEGNAWLVTSNAVWHAPVNLEVSDLTDDVLELDLQQSHERGRVRLTLRNDDGRYQQPNVPPALSVGGELLIDPGYLTSVGIEVSEGMRFWISHIRRRTGHGAATVEMEAVDAWGILEAWTASRQLVWHAGTASVSSVMSQLVTRAGLRLVSSGASAESAAFEPAFTVRAGERASVALRRLLSKVPDYLAMRGMELLLHEPLTTDETTYTFGVEHVIASLHVDDDVTDGWVRVFGDSVFAEAVDAASLHPGSTTTIVLDDNLDAQARADARATTVLRRAALDRLRGELVAAPNVAQEIGDVIEVTSAALVLAAVRFRVASFRVRRARNGPRPMYEMTVALSDV